MKKILLVVALFSSVVLNAQVWLGGSIGLDVTKPDLVGAKSTTTFSISPEIGYSSSERFDVAMSLSETMMSHDGTVSHLITVDPYVRWSFVKCDKVSFFIDGGFGVGYAEFADGAILDDSQIKFYIGVRPGIKLALTNNVGLVAKLGFIGYQKVINAYETFGLNVNNTSLSFGLYYAF